MDGVYCVGEPQLLVCATPGYSFFFDFIERSWAGDKSHPIHKICSLMRKLGVSHFCREELHPNGELLMERADLEGSAKGTVKFRAERVSFFRHNGHGRLEWRQLGGIYLLGYVVIVTFKRPGKRPRSYIFEAVVRPPTLWKSHLGDEPVSNYFVRGKREFPTVIGTETDHLSLKLCGSFFCQQNGVTHVCAHAALRTAINSSPIHSGSKVTSQRINDSLLRNTVGNQRVGRGAQGASVTGLTPDQIERVAGDLGFRCHIADFTANPSTDYEDFIYPFVESGFPTILGLNPSRVAHVVAVLGHTLNSDRWLPDARQGYGIVPYEAYTSVAAWTDHFIVSDDNLGALVTLPTDSVRNILVPKYNAGLHASIAIGLVPQHIAVSGYSVERCASNLILALFEDAWEKSRVPNRWVKFIKKAPVTIPRVFRTTLQNRDDYLQSLSASEDELGNRLSKEELRAVASRLKAHQFWVTEFTLSNLYTGNRRKLGEAICATNLSDQELVQMKGFMMAWIPEMLYQQGKGSELHQSRREWSLKGHVSLLGQQDSQRSSSEW